MIDLESISAHQRFSLVVEVLLQGFEEKSLLVDLASEQVYQLNRTGARTVQLLSEGRSLGEILAVLSAEFSASPSELERDVRGLLAELLANRLLVCRAG